MGPLATAHRAAARFHHDKPLTSTTSPVNQCITMRAVSRGWRGLARPGRLQSERRSFDDTSSEVLALCRTKFCRRGAIMTSVARLGHRVPERREAPAAAECTALAAGRSERPLWPQAADVGCMGFSTERRRARRRSCAPVSPYKLGRCGSRCIGHRVYEQVART